MLKKVNKFVVFATVFALMLTNTILTMKAEETTDSKEEEVTTVDITNIDLDDDDAVNDFIGTDEKDTNTELTIEDAVKNTEKELEVISKIEHMLTPEVREYLMEKFKNDKLKYWMANRETSSN